MRHSAIFSLVVLFTCLQYAQAQKYAVTDLGALTGDTYSEGLAVNVWGHVVGCSGNPVYVCPGNTQSTGGFFWTKPAGLQGLRPLPGDTATYGAGINDLDRVVGWSGHAQNGATPSRAVLWTKGRAARDLGMLPGCDSGCSSSADAISDDGLVVGCSSLPPAPYDTWHAFLWIDGLGMRDLGASGFGSSCGVAVNLHAGVVGWLDTLGTATNAFFWTPREGMLNLGTLPGATASWSYAAGVNDFDQVVGQSAYAGGDFTFFHAFLWTRKEGMIDLGVLGGHQYLSSSANAINDEGEIVGYSGCWQCNESAHAVKWTAGKGLQDLNDCIAAQSGWILYNAYAVNALGQIAGYGTINGEYHAFLLTPQRHLPE